MPILGLLLAAVIVASAADQSATQRPAATGTAVDIDLLGPRVGEPVPDFSAPDQLGQARTLQSILGPRGAVLVFFRSADW